MMLRLAIFSATLALVLPAAAKAAAGDTSAGARADKSWLVALRGGNFLGGVTGFGVEAGMSLGSSWQLGVLGMTGSADMKDQIDDDDPVLDLEEFTADGQIVQAQARYFVGNSFYVSGALGMRRVGFAMKIAEKGGDGRVDSTAEATSTIVALNLGNVWAWRNGFFIGADWIGYSLPLTSSYKSTVKTEGSATDEINDLNEIVQDGAKRLGSTPSGQLLVLNIGWML